MYERLVKSVKLALKKTLGAKYLTKAELETVIFEIESCINSRPLTYVSYDDDLTVITPAHFILGRNAFVKPECDIDPSAVTPVDHHEKLMIKSFLLNKFWKIWTQVYITNLPPIVHKFSSKCKLKPGSMVIIKDENIPRLMWPMGIITQVFPGRDGMIRNVNVKTSKGVLNRSVHKLHDLEIIHDNPENIIPTVRCKNVIVDKENDIDDAVPTVKTRSGRIFKPVHR